MHPGHSEQHGNDNPTSSTSSDVGESFCSQKVIVIVLTIMKPGRISRKIVLRAGIFTILFTMITFVVLLTLFMSVWQRGPTYVGDGYRESNFNAPVRKRLRLLAKDSFEYHGSVSHTDASDINEKSDPVWDITTYKQQGEVTPECRLSAVLLILITSSPENQERRDAIRRTWCDAANSGYNRSPWQCVFMIGQTADQTLNAQIDKEIIEEEDILRGSYLDFYRNLTLKVILGFDWAAKNCHQCQYVLKTDDDCFVNTGLLYDFLMKDNIVSSNLYVGNVFLAEDKRLVVRVPRNRWFVSETDFVEKLYPPYASGTGYLMSYDVLQRVVAVSRFVRPFPVEDAYVGLLVSKLGIEPIASLRFTLYGVGWQLCNYFYLLVIHGVKPVEQHKMLRQAISAAATERCLEDQTINGWR